jgi:DNA mismatch repair protein MLH1
MFSLYSLYISSCISIHVESGNKLTISDDGCGIRPVDLGLAATRFATSKLKQLTDFDSLTTFGFRGEALASVSLVSRLSICSRIPENPVGYVQNYNDGVPVLEKVKPQARSVGTTVIVKDLFYNLPHRQRSNEREEYQRVLSVVQAYAVHYACQQVQFVCRHKSKVDLNTTTLVDDTPSEREEYSTVNTERVLKHVYGSQLQFTSFDCKQQDEQSSSSECTYSCHGMISTTPPKKTTLILFCNDRLVECPPLKKLVNEVIKVPCICYIAIRLPPTQVDVNVHPTKKHVTMLHQDEVLNGIQTALQELVQNQPQSFASASVQVIKNPYNKTKKRKAESQQSVSGTDENRSRPKPLSTATRTVAPNALVRTTRSAPAGAIEPFLVKASASVDNQGNKKTHVASCPLSDLSIPGAFAKQCTCPLVNASSNRMVRPKRIIPTKCTYSSIQSLREKLWKHSSKYAHVKNMLREAVWVGHVPQSRQSLIQVGVELWMWNWRDLGQQLFYQLALLQFGGLRAATLKGRVDVTKIMAFAMELEEGNDDDNADIIKDSDANSISSNKSTNWELATQATTCLMERAEMLDEYFSIRLVKDGDDVYLEALPILLNGYEPSPAGLAVFLLRLATEVNWNDEKPCFRGICRELGHYYSVVEQGKSVQHMLFPAISCLLSPTPRVEASMRKLTVLSNLYKAFDR